MIAWIAIAVLATSVCILFSLYRRALGDAFAVSSLLQMVLLDENNFRLQREEFLKTVHQSNAQSPAILGARMNAYICNFAVSLHKTTNFFAGMSELLWAERHGSRTQH